MRQTYLRAIHTCLAGSLSAALLCAPLPAFAAEPEPSEPASVAVDDSEALSGEAVKAFEAKQYDASVELFKQAYAADPQPNYLFNIGRVYEEQGNLPSAVEFYSKFVAQPGVDIKAREAALERLKVLRATVEALEDKPEQPPLTPTNDDDNREPAKNRNRTVRIMGYSLLGVGGAILAVGGVFGGLARANVNDANDAQFVDNAAKLRNDAKSQARAADAMFITGGVLATAGLIVVITTFTGRNKTAKKTANRTTWVPTFSRGRLGLGVQHRF